MESCLNQGKYGYEGHAAFYSPLFQVRMNNFKKLCVDTLKSKCLNEKQVTNISYVITDADFETLNLPLDPLDREKVSDCLNNENVYKNCDDCSKNCGVVLRKGE